MNSLPSFTGFIDPNLFPKQHEEEKDIAPCNKCGCEWFEQVSVNRYQKYHSVVLGQGVPVAGPQMFILLRCVRCAELHEPNVQLNTYDTARKLYEKFTKAMESPPNELTKK